MGTMEMLEDRDRRGSRPHGKSGPDGQGGEMKWERKVGGLRDQSSEEASDDGKQLLCHPRRDAFLRVPLASQPAHHPRV